MESKSPRWTIRLGLMAAAGLATPSLAELPTYSTFAIQARTGTAVVPGFNLPADCSMQGQTPDIDQAGVVACRLLKPAGDGVFVGPGNGTGTLVINDPLEYTGTLDIDSSRGLMVLARLGGGAEVRNLQGSLLRDYPLGGPENVGLISGASLGSGTSILYRSTNAGVHKLVQDDVGGATRTSVVLLQNGAGVQTIFPPASSAGRMACVVNLAAGGAEVRRVGPLAGESVTIASTGAAYSGFAEGLDIDPSGKVAFAAHRTSDQVFELLVGDEAGAAVYARVGDLGIVDSGFVNRPPAINASLVVAFRARDASGDAIFIADGTSVARVIGDGDVVQTDVGPMTLGFDSPIDGRLAIDGGIAINDLGQIVFNGVLSNGSNAIFIAQPDPVNPGCPADLDDGSGTGNPDGAITIDDLLYFLVGFEAGDAAVDLDDGSGTGTSDGAVTIDDLLFFLIHFENGC